MKPAKILIIEDEVLLSDAYRIILKHQGYTVDVAMDGEEGLAKLKQFKPQLILLDVLMPKLDGIGFLQKSDIKQKHPHIKVVACTNLSDPQTAERMVALGADRLALKSDLSPKQLVSLIESLLAQ